jgi:hypothetical protein
VADSFTRLLRTGIKTIANADGPVGTAGTLMNLCNRSTLIMVDWRTIATATPPVLAIMVAVNPRIGGDGNKRRATVLVGAFAEGTGAQAKVENLVQRVKEILTPARFQALTPSMDCVVLDATDRDPGDDFATDEPTHRASSHLDLVIVGNAPQ